MHVYSRRVWRPNIPTYKYRHSNTTNHRIVQYFYPSAYSTDTQKGGEKLERLLAHSFRGCSTVVHTSPSRNHNLFFANHQHPRILARQEDKFKHCILTTPLLLQGKKKRAWFGALHAKKKAWVVVSSPPLWTGGNRLPSAGRGSAAEG